MTEQEYIQLDDKQKQMVATAFLMDHPEQRPEASKRFFDKLDAYDESARRINESIKQAQKSVQELGKQLNQTVGSINAISGLIFEELPAERVREWCLQFDMSEAHKQAEKDTPKSQSAPDIAGHTARAQQQKIIIPR
jgi:hypothetical protein